MSIFLPYFASSNYNNNNKMENIISQIPQNIIEMYKITEDEHSVSLYCNPKNLLGYIALPTNDLRIEESETCFYLKTIGKFSLSLWKEVQATHLTIF